MKIVNAFKNISSVLRGLNGRKKINSIVFSNVLLQSPNPHPKISKLRDIVKIMEPMIVMIILVFVGFMHSLKFILQQFNLIFINIMLFWITQLFV